MEKAALKGKQRVWECAREKVPLSDSSKFGRVSFAKICGIDRFRPDHHRWGWTPSGWHEAIQVDWGMGRRADGRAVMVNGAAVTGRVPGL